MTTQNILVNKECATNYLKPLNVNCQTKDKCSAFTWGLLQKKMNSSLEDIGQSFERTVCNAEH